MLEIKVFTVSGCGFCVRAKSLLDSKGAAYDEVNVSLNAAERSRVVAQTGHWTFPQIFLGETFIGGCDELYALDRAGRLDAMLA